MSFHFFHINEIYSNADGTIQFVELVGDANNQHFWSGHQLISRSGGDSKTFNITQNLPSSSTAGKPVLFATQAFADRYFTPDFIIPDGFLFINNGSVEFPGLVPIDTESWTTLPTNGTTSLNADGSTGRFSPANFAGDSILPGTSGANNLNGGAGKDLIQGLGGNDTLIGGAGNDTLDGGGGSDSMTGGSGNDLFFVNAAGDVVKESAGGGTDMVRSSVTEMLAGNVEKLLLTGAGNIRGTGNGLDNTLTGNKGRNVLDGKGGADIVKGGSGNDTLVWDAADTRLDGGGGMDTLKISGSAVTITLSALPNGMIRNVEIINLTGNGDNALNLNLEEVLAISSSSDTLRIIGDAGDAVQRGDGWVQGSDTIIGSTTYRTFTQDVATLLVDSDISLGT